MHTTFIVSGYGICPAARTAPMGRNATSYTVDVAGRARRVYRRTRGPAYRGDGAFFYVNVDGARVAVYTVPA